MNIHLLLAIALLSATTSVICGAPVRSGGDQAVDRSFWDNIQDSYWQAMALQHQLSQLAEQIEDADENSADSEEIGQLTAQLHQLQAQAQPLIDQIYG